MIIDIISFSLGTLILYYGAEYLIQGSKSIAIIFNIPSVIVGVTLVALGTSLPELIVSVLANIKGETGIVIGNVMGSNITNISLVLGLTALVKPIVFPFKQIKDDINALIIITALPVIFIFWGDLTNIHGLFFLIFMVGYIIKLVIKKKRFTAEGSIEKNNYLIIIVKVIVGILGLALGANLFVEGATGIARYLGIPSVVIGMSLVALGTSLPELITSIVATRHGEIGFLIGNVIGSNFMNITVVLGISLLFQPIEINFYEVMLQSIIMILLTWFLFYLLKLKEQITKISGSILIVSYIVFLFFNFYLV